MSAVGGPPLARRRWNRRRVARRCIAANTATNANQVRFSAGSSWMKCRQCRRSRVNAPQGAAARVRHRGLKCCSPAHQALVVALAGARRPSPMRVEPGSLRVSNMEGHRAADVVRLPEVSMALAFSERGPHPPVPGQRTVVQRAAAWGEAFGLGVVFAVAPGPWSLADLRGTTAGGRCLAPPAPARREDREILYVAHAGRVAGRGQHQEDRRIRWSPDDRNRWC